MQQGDKAEKKAIFYESKYDKKLRKVSTKLLSDLTPPQLAKRIRFSR